MREFLSVDEFVERHRDPVTGQRRVGRDQLYRAIRAGEFPAVRVGRRLLVPSDALEQLIQRSDVAIGSTAFLQGSAA